MFLKLLCILLVTVSYGLILSSFVIPRLNSLSFREGKYEKSIQLDYTRFKCFLY